MDNPLKNLIYGGLEQGCVIYGLDNGEDEDCDPTYLLGYDYRLCNTVGQFITMVHPLEIPNLDIEAYYNGYVHLHGWGCMLTQNNDYWHVL